MDWMSDSWSTSFFLSLCYSFWLSGDSSALLLFHPSLISSDNLRGWSIRHVIFFHVISHVGLKGASSQDGHILHHRMKDGSWWWQRKVESSIPWWNIVGDSHDSWKRNKVQERKRKKWKRSRENKRKMETLGSLLSRLTEYFEEKVIWRSASLVIPCCTPVPSSGGSLDPLKCKSLVRDDDARGWIRDKSSTLEEPSDLRDPWNGVNYTLKVDISSFPDVVSIHFCSQNYPDWRRVCFNQE